MSAYSTCENCMSLVAGLTVVEYFAWWFLFTCCCTVGWAVVFEFAPIMNIKLTWAVSGWKMWCHPNVKTLFVFFNSIFPQQASHSLFPLVPSAVLGATKHLLGSVYLRLTEWRAARLPACLPAFSSSCQRLWPAGAVAWSWIWTEGLQSINSLFHSFDRHFDLTCHEQLKWKLCIHVN